MSNVIQVGQEFKSYRALCTYIGEPIKGGKSRQLQEKNWLRFFTYHNKGNKIIIDEVFAEEKPKIDNRVNNGSDGNTNNKYTKYIDKLVVDMLLAYDGEMADTVNNIFSSKDMIPIFNDYWMQIKQHGDKPVAIKYKVKEFTVMQYCQQVRTVVTNMFKSSLNRLQKKGILTWDKQYLLKSNKHSDNEILASEYDDDMVEYIKNTEDDVLKELEMTRVSLFNGDNYTDFRERVKLYIKEYTDDDVWNYWSAYHITLNNKDLASEYKIEDDNAKQDIIKELTYVLNLSIHKSLSKKSVNRVTDDGFIVQGKHAKYNPFMADKIVKFVLAIEQEIFIHITNETVSDDDVMKYKVTKLELATMWGEPNPIQTNNIILEATGTDNYSYEDEGVPF